MILMIHECADQHVSNPNAIISLAPHEVLLEKHSMFHILALLYVKHERYDLALQIWLAMARGEKTDVSDRDGYREMIDFLRTCPDQRVIWTYSKFVLEANHPEAIQIFTNEAQGLKYDHVCFLSPPFPPFLSLPFSASIHCLSFSPFALNRFSNCTFFSSVFHLHLLILR
jgi:hypothetical protein